MSVGTNITPHKPLWRAQEKLRITDTYLFLFSTCFGHPCAHHQEEITVSMWQWYLSLWMGGVWPADQTPPIHCDKYQRRIDTVISSWWWAHGSPKHVEKINKYIKHNCAPSWIYLRNFHKRQVYTIYYRPLSGIIQNYKWFPFPISWYIYLLVYYPTASSLPHPLSKDSHS